MSRFARSAWLLVLVVGLVLFEVIRRTVIATENPNLLPALIVLGAAIVPAAFVTFVRARKLTFSVDGGTVALIAIVGGIVGIAAAGTLEYDTAKDLGTLPMVAVGVIEEAAKLIAPLAVLLFTRHRRPADGLLVGVASGAGFAALETMGYAFVSLVQSQGDIGAVDGVLLIRGLMSPAAHMAWTGLTATALWYAAIHRWKLRPVLRFAGVYLVAVVLHAAWDSIGTTPGYAVIAAVSLLLLGLTVHRLRVHETRDNAVVTGRPVLAY
ncbi:PrsW family intramembrane metalloprotease [Winogradskya consettensis]|nr:PrsW family intramembrane metalloprotease [Actinoplanes consettensis]